MKTKKSSFSTPASAPPTVGGPAPRPVAQDLIAERARAIWRERGSPAGKDMEHWLEAERQLHRPGVRDAMEPASADFSPDPDNALKDEVDKEIDDLDQPSQQRSATSL